MVSNSGKQWTCDADTGSASQRDTLVIKKLDESEVGYEAVFYVNSSASVYVCKEKLQEIISYLSGGESEKEKQLNETISTLQTEQKKLQGRINYLSQYEPQSTIAVSVQDDAW